MLRKLVIGGFLIHAKFPALYHVYLIMLLIFLNMLKLIVGEAFITFLDL